MGKTTLVDIAKAANVSKATVSMVLNNKDIKISKSTRELILKTAKDLNYVPNYLAKSLSTKKSYSIGFIVPDIQNPFFSEMAKAIEKILEENGYSMILCNSFNEINKEEKYMRLLISKAIDGVIIAPTEEVNNQFKILKDNNVPFVIVDRVVNNEDYISVVCDNRKGIEMGIDYLYNKGKRNIAFIGGNKEFNIANIRLEKYIEMVSNLGIYNKEFNIEDEFSMYGGFRATEKLMNKNLTIDGIFYSSDVMAIGGMKYLLRNGYKIPEDISVLGFDNIDISFFIEPELTTIAQPIYRMGEEATRLLIDKINKIEIKESILVLEPRLIERGTVK